MERMKNKTIFFLIAICTIMLSFSAVAEEVGVSLENLDNIDGEEVMFDNEPDFGRLSIDKEESGKNVKKGFFGKTEDLKEGGETEEIVYPKKTLNEIDPSNFTDVVVLQGLDKITAKSSYLTAKVGDKIEFKRLEIYPLKCWKAPPTEKPENKILLKVYENKLNGDREQIFYGWMFSSSPALSTLEHPVYDLTAIECKFSEEKQKEIENGK